MHGAALLDNCGISVLLVEQNLRDALELADYAYVLQSGCIVLDGPASAVKESELVRRAYLGL